MKSKCTFLLAVFLLALVLVGCDSVKDATWCVGKVGEVMSEVADSVCE